MYIDLLIKIKNAQAVKKENIKVAYSKMDEAVLEILTKNHLVDSYEKKGRGPKKVLDIKLRYDEGRGVISGIKIISKPSRRLYLGYRDLKPVMHGYGFSVLSTPKGVMTNKEARKSKMGGEILFSIW